MKKYILPLSLAAVLLTAISVLIYTGLYYQGYFGGYVEQKVKQFEGCYLPHDCLVTYTWYNGKIIATSFESLHTLNDSIKQLRLDQAHNLLNTLNK